jgi:hypothetical protein
MMALKVCVEQKPEVIDFDGSLEAMQEIVEGYIERVFFTLYDTEFEMWVNEEGSFNGCLNNDFAGGLVGYSRDDLTARIFGNVLITIEDIEDEDGSRGLSPSEMNLIFDMWGSYLLSMKTFESKVV